MTKAQFREWLSGHFLLRLHMSLMLGATFLAGLAATKVLLVAGVNLLALRYVLAVVAAYLAFLLMIRLWIAYVRSERVGIDFSGDGVDLIQTTGRAGDTALRAGGGRFGGGGATGSWGESRAVAAPVKSGSSLKLDLGLDVDDWMVVVLFLALVVALVVIAAYVIYTAPAILSEAAFEAGLAAALARRAKKVARPGWIGAVWRATVWPFAIVVILSGALGWAAQRYCPDAHRLRDVLHCRSRTK